MTAAPRSPSLSALVLRLWAHLEHPTMDPTTPMSCVEIPVTRGMTAYVSLEDADLAKYKWFAHMNRQKFYVARNVAGKGVSLHRLIASRMVGQKLGAREEITFADENSLNCTRGNIVFGSGLHLRERTLPKNNRTGYRGVSALTDGRCYARVFVNGVRYYLGIFDDARLANQACRAKEAELLAYEMSDRLAGI